MKPRQTIFQTLALLLLLGAPSLLLTASAQAPPPPARPAPQLPPIPITTDTTHSLALHFTPASASPIPPQDRGFIRRWLVLEPVKKDIGRNNILTETYLRTCVASDNFSGDFNSLPRAGEKVTIGSQELSWHALDSRTFNFNLYHFAYALSKPKYGMLVWLVTVVDSPAEMPNLRMTAGCNSASIWWLNGNEIMALAGDRDLVVDNFTSPRITLKKGKNIIRGAVINGPGMANFCVRFVDEKGSPVKNLRIGIE